jgi:hypothetical protein
VEKIAEKLNRPLGGVRSKISDMGLSRQEILHKKAEEILAE